MDVTITEQGVATYVRSNKPGSIEKDPLLEPKVSESSIASASHRHDGTSHHHDHVHVPIGLVSAKDLPNSKAVIVAHILELGIIMHSILIGINLGTTTNANTLHPLLIAIVFHQFFEGVGLGGAIAIARVSRVKTLFFASLFSITTPTGRLIIHQPPR